jgi:hypothetical protein
MGIESTFYNSFAAPEFGWQKRRMAIALANAITHQAFWRLRLSCVLGMLSSLEVKVLRPT